MLSFKYIFDKIIKEDVDTDSAGIGDTSDSVFSSDFYATGDARIPWVYGSSTGKSGKKKKRRVKIHRRPRIGYG